MMKLLINYRAKAFGPFRGFTAGVVKEGLIIKEGAKRIARIKPKFTPDPEIEGLWHWRYRGWHVRKVKTRSGNRVFYTSPHVDKGNYYLHFLLQKLDNLSKYEKHQ